MRPLKDVIVALRREMEAAFGNDQNLGPGRQIEADRVVLSLQIDILEQPGIPGSTMLSFEVPDSPSQPPTAHDRQRGGHLLTIEFKCAPHQSHSAPSKFERGRERTIPGTPPKLEGAEAEQVQRSLEQVLGSPGFDSSARATVFAEALRGLSDEQIRSIFAQLDRSLSPRIDKSDKRIRHHLNNVIRSGPLKSVTAARDVLTDLFQKHASPEILSLIRTVWKSQEEWNTEG